MKTLKLLAIPLITICILFAGCKKDPVAPKLNTLEVTEITETSAKTGGNIMDDGGAEIEFRGIIWGKTSDITLSNFEGNSMQGSGKGEFSHTITGLEPGITYYVKAFANNKAGTAYAEHKEFTTLVTLPELTTLPVIEITPDKALVRGQIIQTHGHTILEAGICWSLNTIPTIDNNEYVSAEIVYGEFYSFITSLNPGTKYYFRAYVTTSHGVAYGNEVSFTTPASYNIISIEDLKDSYTGTLQEIIQNVVIEAIVTANDKSGNLYKKLVLQDETAAIEIHLDKVNLFVQYPVGQKVYVKCKELYIGDYNNLLLLGYIYQNNIGRIPWQFIADRVIRDPVPVIVPEPLTLESFQDINFNMVSKLVRFENVSFDEPGVPFASQQLEVTNRIILDGNNRQLFVRTSKYSNFADQLTPEGVGNITGILSVFGSFYQLFLRDIDDVGNFSGNK